MDNLATSNIDHLLSHGIENAPGARLVIAQQ